MEASAVLEQLEGVLWGDKDASEVDRALNAVEKLAVFTSAIAALEELAGAKYFDEKGPYPWRVTQKKLEYWNSWLRFTVPIMKYPRVLVLPQVRLAAALRLLLGNPGRKERAALVAAVLGSTAATKVHHHYGSDGADQVSFIALLVAMVAKAFPNDERARRACLRMIAFQSCLAYSASGGVKLASSTWRSGRAITGVFRTVTFGDEDFYKLVQLHPALPKLVAWSVILAEVLFPVVLVAPEPARRAILGGMGVFHLANSRFMGLNRFPFAFAATYPAVAYVAKES